MGMRDDVFERLDADLRSLGSELEQRQDEADIDASEDELEALRQVRDARAQLLKDVDEARRAADPSKDTATQRIKDAFNELKARVQHYRSQAGERHRIYSDEQDASLRKMGAQLDAAEAALQRGDANTSMMTRAELTAIRQQLAAARDGLRRLVGRQDAPYWGVVRAEYEASWRILRAKADVLNNLPVAGQHAQQ